MSFVSDAKVGFRESDELMLVRSLCLGQIESKRPELCPRFFEVDLAPCILKFLRRDGGVCCNELTKGTDNIFCTVLIWFTSALPLLLVVESMLSSAAYSEWNNFKKMVSVNNVTRGGYDSTWLFTSTWAEKVGSTWTVNMTRLELADKLDPPVQFVMTSQLYEDGYILRVLGVSMAVFLFCLYGLRVLWPKRFQSKLQLATTLYRILLRRMLIVW